MTTLIDIFTTADILLAILLVVVSMARLDSRYASKVRAEVERKSLLRGERRYDDDY